MRAAFHQIDITPPVPCYKVGWIRKIVGRRVRDPIRARIAVFEAGRSSVAFIALDTLSVRWTQVARIRKAVEKLHGFSSRNVLIAATHNHAGPAVTHEGEVPRDEAYLARMVDRVVAGFGVALRRMVPARAAFGRSIETEVAHNRRVVFRNGLTRTHGSLLHPDALHVEGPIDPVVAVMSVRATSGEPLGLIVNYAMHPTHHGDDDVITANWPGEMCRRLKRRGWPVTLFLQGAAGNITTVDQIGGREPAMERVGRVMAAAVERALVRARYRPVSRFGAAATTVKLPFRRVTPAEIAGTVRGAQRFIDPKLYDRAIPRLLRKIRARRGRQLAEVQALRVDDHVFVSIPAEFFVELGLKIKQQAYPLHAHVVSLANGIVGYVPTKEAFSRGGYETTFIPGAMLAPEAGDLLVAAARKMVRSVNQ